MTELKKAILTSWTVEILRAMRNLPSVIEQKNTLVGKCKPFSIFILNFFLIGKLKTYKRTKETRK